MEEIDHAVGFGYGTSPKDIPWSKDPEFRSAALFYKTTLRTGKCAIFEFSNSRQSGKQAIRLAHQQYKKFLLLDPNSQGFGCEVNARTRGFFLPAETDVRLGVSTLDQRDLGLQCILYLANNVHTFGHGSGERPVSNDEFDRLLATPSLAFLSYAATHWYIHVSKWNKQTRAQFISRIMPFLSRNYNEFLLTTRIQARHAPHLFESPSNPPLPSWISEISELNERSFLYKLFVKEWGYVLRTAGVLSRIPVSKEHEKEPVYNLPRTQHPYPRYNSETLVSGVGWLDGPRNIYNSRFRLRERYWELPHARVSALHTVNIGSENFTPEVMILDTKSRALDLTWSMWQCFLTCGSSPHPVVTKLDDLGVCPWYPRDGTRINKRIVLPEYIEIPNEGSSTVFSVETARRGTKIVISIVSASQDPEGDFWDSENDGSGSKGGIALGVIDIGTCERPVDSDIDWFTFDGLNLRRTFPDTAVPVFHPTEPLVLWAVSVNEIVVGNYETGFVRVVKYSPASYLDGTSGDLDDEQEGSQGSDSDDDSDDESADDIFTTTIGNNLSDPHSFALN